MILEQPAPIRWRDYLLYRGDEFSDFWRMHLAEGGRSILLVLGKGFDPRTCMALRILAELAGSSLSETMALEFDEGGAVSNQALRDLANANAAELEALVAGKGGSSTYRILFRTEDGRRVCARNAANVFVDESRIAAFSDVVVDISAMPRSVYFPLIARLLYFHDDLKRHGREAPNIHVVVAEDPALDCQISEEGVDETASFLHPFRGRIQP